MGKLGITGATFDGSVLDPASENTPAVRISTPTSGFFRYAGMPSLFSFSDAVAAIATVKPGRLGLLIQ